MKVTKLIALIINLLVVFSFLSAQAGIDEHTVGIWLFDEGTGNKVKDLTDNGNHGDFQGKVKWVDGKFSKALEFKGEGGSVMVPNSKSLDIKKHITIEAWINFSDAGKGKDMVIAREEPAYSLQKFNNDMIEGWVHVGGWQGVRGKEGGKVLKPSIWYHVAYSYDGKVLKTYVDGELDRENKIPGDISIVDVPFTIGSYKGTGYLWQGQVDEVRVSNVARSQEEIKAVMSGFEAFLGVAPGDKLATRWGRIKKAKR